MQICRAEDGQVFQVNATLYDIAKKPNTLRPLLSSLTSIDPGSIIMFLSDGQQLREDNLRELSGAQDQSIFVFNRDYLDLDIDEVMNVLGVREGEGLTPSVLQEDSISSLHTSQILQDNLSRANQHQSYISALLQQIHSQHEALIIASSNLDMHVLTLTEAWSALKETIGAGLESQTKLLEGIDYDLDSISQLTVHPEFLSGNTTRRNGVPATPNTPNTEKDSDEMKADGAKTKMLGEYVSRPKMKVVVESCKRVHVDLVNRFRNASTSMEDLVRGAAEVRDSIHSDGKLSEASQSTKNSLDDLERMSALISAWSESEEPTEEESEALMAEIRVLDNAIRQEVVAIGEIKNRHTRHLLVALRHISTLQSSIFSLPGVLSSLESDLRVKGGFSHLQRLHGMAFAYGASVIEVVRRREFGKFFMQRAQAMAEIMAKFSASERKRRQVYRGESLSQLPFEIKGMDLPAPSLEISTIGTEEGPYDLGREDVEVLLEAMRHIEEDSDLNQLVDVGSESVQQHPVKDTREALEKLVTKMDNLEADFDKIAEKSILSSTRLAYYKRRSVNEATAYNEAAEQLRELQTQQAAQEQTYANERRSLQARIRDLENHNQQMNSQLPHLESTIEHLETLLHQARNNVEQTHTKYEQSYAKNETYEQDLRQRNSEISKLLDQLTQEENSRQLLEMERTEIQETRRNQDERIDLVNQELVRHVERIATLDRDTRLMAEENKLLADRDGENRKRIEELERQLQQAREEGNEARSHLKDTLRERDRLLRDHQVEADGDRAVLEKRFHETKAQLETSRQLIQDLQQRLAIGSSQIDSLQSQNSILRADLSSLREELQRTSQELATSSQVENNAHLRENTLRAELNFANNALVQMEGKMERTERILAQVFDVAIRFRNSHAKAMAQAQVMLRPIAPKSSLAAATAPNGQMGESTVIPPSSSIGIEFGTSPRTTFGIQPAPPERPPSPTPIDPSDPLTALDTLREFDLDAFAETIAKTGLTIRKWQKQCKEYRERAKGKISFRNFQKGDLALFLPTRNSVARPWAAFNMSFPHYFLNATGHVAEQLKTREWIVARITSITERVVDSKDPTSNPYGLGNGVKYYILEVEDWSVNNTGGSVRAKPQRNTSTPSRPGLSQIESWRDSAAMSQSTSLPPLLPLQAKQEEDPDILEGITALPTRPRAATASSTGAGPSSLSKLLAQAHKEPTPPQGTLAKVETRVQESPKEALLSLPAEPVSHSEEAPSKNPSPVTENFVDAKDSIVSLPKPPEDNGESPEADTSQILLTSPKPQPSSRPYLSPRVSPKPSPRQRPISLLMASGTPLSSTSNVNVKGSTAIMINDPNRRHDSVRSSMSSTRPTSIPRRPPFALSSSPVKAAATTSISDVMTSPSQEFNSPFRLSEEDLQRHGRIEEQETPSPADSVTEGMNSVLWGHARRRTTSTITPATAALSHSVARNNQPSAPSPLSGVSSVFSSLTGWRRKRPESMIVSENDVRRPGASQPIREHRPSASESFGAASLLKRFESGE